MEIMIYIFIVFIIAFIANVVRSLILYAKHPKLINLFIENLLDNSKMYGLSEKETKVCIAFKRTFYYSFILISIIILLKLIGTGSN
jgi:hypothetical protein